MDFLLLILRLLLQLQFLQHMMIVSKFRLDRLTVICPYQNIGRDSIVYTQIIAQEF